MTLCCNYCFLATYVRAKAKPRNSTELNIKRNRSKYSFLFAKAACYGSHYVLLLVVLALRQIIFKCGTSTCDWLLLHPVIFKSIYLFTLRLSAYLKLRHTTY